MTNANTNGHATVLTGPGELLARIIGKQVNGMNIPDNYDRWESHDAEQERKLAKLPICENARIQSSKKKRFTTMTNGFVKNANRNSGMTFVMIFLPL